MSLSILEERLKDELPAGWHKTVEQEFARFESERNRMSNDDEKLGQAMLTRRELNRLPTTNQHGREGFTTIELQCIKAAAMKYRVSDWVSQVDSSLSYEENIELMREKGTGATMRDMEPILGSNRMR